MPQRTLPRQLAVSALFSFVLAGSLTGCGGSDSDGGSTPSPSTAPSTAVSAEPSTDATVDDASFADDANAVCAAIYPDINAVAQTLDPADPSTVTTDFLPLVQQLQDELVALTPSPDLAEGYAAVLAVQQTNLDAITADPAALFEIDGSATDAEFDALGITDCGSGSVDLIN